MSATYHVGDVRAVLADIPDGSVDAVICSPPFLSLRSYLPADHPNKALEIGSEPTPAEFLSTLLGLSAEWRRVLTPHGSIAIELGDTYAGSGGAGGDYGTGERRDGQAKFNGSALADRKNKVLRADGNRPQQGPGWPLDKSLTMVPELYRVALAYGIHPLTGEQSPAGRWRVRNVIRWCRPNPPVGALGDKVRPATTDIVTACLSRSRWFDLDACRTPLVKPEARYVREKEQYADSSRRSTLGPYDASLSAGAPPLDHWWHDDTVDQDAWNLSTAPYKGAHFAAWNPELARRLILLMCPRRVCRQCGEPSRRIVNVGYDMDGGDREARPRSERFSGGMLDGRVHNDHRVVDHTTIGWSSCECPGTGGLWDDGEYVGRLDGFHEGDGWRPGIVLDPFAGTGTTLMAASDLGRDSIGIDLDSRNADLALERCGMFLEVAG